MSEYLVIIEPAEDGTGFGAYVPDLPGCVATGRTREEGLPPRRRSPPRSVLEWIPHSSPTIRPPPFQTPRPNLLSY